MEAPAPHTNGSINGDAGVEPSTAFDPDIFRKYLLALLPPLIAADPEDLDTSSTLFDTEFDERVARFATESGGVIYIVKTKEESDGTCVYVLQCWGGWLNG